METRKSNIVILKNPRRGISKDRKIAERRNPVIVLIQKGVQTSFDYVS